METGHLDRVVHGHVGDDILAACDEHTISVNVGDNVGSNPALHFFRGLRHRNLAAIKLAAQSGMSQLQVILLLKFSKQKSNRPWTFKKIDI
jgi:hypothetical protein